MSKTSPRPLSELDLASRQRIEALTAKEPVELSNADRAFMRGRADYLTEEQVADYATEDIVEETDEVTDEDSYENWSMADLRAEAQARGLEVSGRGKAPYVAALEANDAEA